jgi:hypothetical protein
MRVIEKSGIVKILLTLLLVSFAATSLTAWELPLTIAGDPGHNYYKPEIGFAPSGAVHIVYRDKGPGSDSDIYMCTYDGKEMTYENVSNSVQFWPNYKSYESDIEVTADGRIHVAWVTHDRNAKNTHYVKYRYKDGNTWSDIVDMATLHMHTGDVIFDLRLGVSNNGNVHIIMQEEHQTIIRYVAKYGDVITPLAILGNGGSRLKHPDIAVDDNYVHAIWMRKVGYPYVIMHQKWENKLGGTQGEIRQVTFPKGDYASQKSRIDLDSQGLLHLAEFYKTGVIKKLKYWQELPDGSFAPYVNMSSPTKLMLYHWAALEVRDNSVIATMQLGSSSGGTGLYFNWKRNGEWGGYAAIPNTDGAVHQSTDLSADGLIAATAYGRFDSSIMLVSSEPISASGTLETQFTQPGTVFYGTDITFDASQCPGLNPDYKIVNYEWDFGDGLIENTSSPTITHTYYSYNTDVQVKLTLTAETGENGIATKDIHIHALYNGIVTGVEAKNIRTLFFNRAANRVTWGANSKNADAGYPSIAKYEIWRAPYSGFVTNSSYVLVGEVTSGVTAFMDYFGVQAGVTYVYSIRSVDSEGHKSPFNNL